ncbi:hypothetical protein BDZ94DRAFT_1305486 [Collybia nuda]|uniref:Uncharacterized protein n=1 Tax=Collybia nuda TaxID=64659 RepID=A0A9P5YF57_9AGAR|nr:hypothetical protein BDZ94DRAFT_1305486 [Collybia nuda]
MPAQSFSATTIEYGVPRQRQSPVSPNQDCPRHSDLVGHAFATTWDVPGGTIGWITQLVDSITMRQRYIATQLLQTLKTHEVFKDVTIVGLVSSHPAVCNALAKYAGVKVDEIDLEFIKTNASSILSSTSVSYVKDAALRGSLFQDKEDYEPGAVSSAYTEFFVDHGEPLRALETLQRRKEWCLGELLDGHEFVVLLPVPPKEVLFDGQG